MAYKAPILMRLFHYALWAVMVLVVAWFFLIPMFLRATAPQPRSAPTSAPASTSQTSQDPAISVVAP